MVCGNSKYALAISCNSKEINIDIETLKLYIDECFPRTKSVLKDERKSMRFGSRINKHLRVF